MEGGLDGRTDAPQETLGMERTQIGMTARRRLALAAAVVMSLVSAARAQDTVTLMGSADAQAGKPVVLRDVAELSGPAAESLAEVVVLESWPAASADQAWTTVDVAAVKAALNKSGKVNWGRVSLNGSACTVRRGAPKDAAPAAPQATATAAAPEARVETAAGPKVRDLIPARIAQTLGIEERVLRVTMDESAKGLLDTPTGGRKVEITPGGVSDKMPLTIRVYEKDRMVASGPAKATVQVKRDVLVSKAALKRNDVLDLSKAAIETRWVGATLDVAGLDTFGSVVRSGQIKIGQVITKADLEPAVVIKKGEAISVSCVAGSIILKTLARATQDGRVDEIIKFETTDANKKKRTFMARVAGPGRAVTVAAGTDEPAENAEAPVAVSDRAGA